VLAPKEKGDLKEITTFCSVKKPSFYARKLPTRETLLGEGIKGCLPSFENILLAGDWKKEDVKKS